MRKTIIILLSCTLVLLAGYSGYRGYKVWKQHRMLNLARAYAAKGDPKNTYLALSQVLRLNPVHLEACRMMAQLAEAGRSSGAVLWRSRVVEINPRSTDDRLALARTAMLFHEYAAATNSLAGIDATGKKSTEYHNLAGALAIALGQPTTATAHFQEAIRLEPANLAPQLNLAVLRLHGTNQLDADDARVSLRRIIANPTNATLRCQALRELITDSVRSKQYAQALTFSSDLLRQTNSEFSDKLLRLTILRGTTNSEYKPTMAACQREASTNAAKMWDLASWQKTQNQFELRQLAPERQRERERQLWGEMLSWLQKLPFESQTNQPAALFIAECQTGWCSEAKQWSTFQANLGQQNWGIIDYRRHAFIARALRGQGLDAAAKSEWELAIKTANDQKTTAEQKNTILNLLQTSAEWKWGNEAEALMWVVIRQFPEEKWAPMLLTKVLAESGRTRLLMSLFSQQLKRTPSDLALKNNLAMTAFLLDAQEVKPFELAREVYQKAPTNAAFASTYAFSLHLQKKNAEALNVFKQMDPKYLEHPSIAGYYGLVLKALGNREQALKYLTIPAKTSLLPEERKLFDSAKAS